MACVVSLAFILLGCQTTSPSRARQAERVYLTDATPVALLPFSALGRPYESYQRIEGTFRGSTYLVDAYVRADDTGLVMVAFNSFGTQLFEIDHGQDGVRFSTSFPAGGMKPEYILEDFQLCFFPADAVKRNLESAGLSFDENREGDDVVRTVKSKGQLIIDIRISGSEIRYHNLLRGYQYVIKEK